MHRASLREGFQDDVQRIRARLGIPSSGFTSEEESVIWAIEALEEAVVFRKRKHSGQMPVRFLTSQIEIAAMLDKYKLPPSARTGLENYILNDNKFSSALPNSFAVAMDMGYTDPTDIFSTREAVWRLSGQKYMRLLLHEGVTKRDVISFLNANWKRIQQKLAVPGQSKPKRIRMTQHKERDALIHEFYSKPRQELGLRRGEYKDVRIASILNEQGHGYSPETVRKVASTQKKKRRPA